MAFATAAPPDPAGRSWLAARPIAHRGLHDAAAGRVENARAAFEAAAAAGYAIELDLRLSADGEAMVFHDATLDRLTSETGPVDARPAAALRRIRLAGTQETVPDLAEVLDLVAGRVPLLLELKTLSGPVGPLEARVAALLRRYGGPVAVQSFHPASVGWFARHAPHLTRGQLSTSYSGTEARRLNPLMRFALRHLLLNPVSRPHFIAYDVKALPSPAPAFCRRLGLPVIAWTVDGPELAARARAHADNIIFEGFLPEAPSAAPAHAA